MKKKVKKNTYYFGLRMDRELQNAINESAALNKRSINSEILIALGEKFLNGKTKAGVETPA